MIPTIHILKKDMIDNFSSNYYKMIQTIFFNTIEDCILLSLINNNIKKMMSSSIISKLQTQYEFISRIGQGSYGQVHLIKNNKERTYALKKVKVDPFEIQQSLKQIDIMKKFIHPNLVRIHGNHFDEENEQLYIIMEYCEEGDLFNYYKSKNKELSIEEIIRIFKQIAIAFIAMNVKGVFHRDLKPENVLIGKGMVIKVADFGCAKAVKGIEISKMDAFSLDKGTPIYASPEQLKNQKYSSKCDIWAAGCMLYLIYYGFHPFLDSRAHNTLNLIRKMTEDKQIEVKPGTDPTIAKLISLTLIFQDKERASWRQLWLSRLFSPKIRNIESYIEYLKNVTIVANWMAKEFWRIRKEYSIGQSKDELLVYFIIKFQYNALKMALKILKKEEGTRYLFEDKSFRAFSPRQQQFNDIKKFYLEHQKYFNSIKKSMQSKDAFEDIQQRQPKRTSPFSDLDNSIRAAYKILLELRGQFENGPSRPHNKIWIALSRWINFQKWFGYQKEPRVEKLITEPITDLRGQVTQEIEKYEMGLVQ